MPLSSSHRTPALRPISLAVVTLMAATSGAWAQAPLTDNPVTADATATLGNVTISGSRESASTRLPLTAKETPQSTTSVPREQMDEQSLTSVDAVLRKVTGVFTSFHDTQRPIYYSRGFKISDFQVDGIPTYSSATNQEYDTAIYENVDIVRGANGILTGIGVPSATVNLIRKRPQRQFGGLGGPHGRFVNLQRAELDLNTPLTADGSVRSRLVLAPQKKESFRQRYAEDKTAALAVLEADVGNATVVSVGYQRQSNEPTAPIWGTIPRFTSTGAVIDLPISTSFSPTWTRWERTSSTLFAKVEHQFNDDWALQATLSRTEGDTFRLSTYGYGLTTSSSPLSQCHHRHGHEALRGSERWERCARPA